MTSTNNNTASVQETLEQINSTLKSSGQHYSGYSCKTVSWDDVQRGTTGSGGGLSCWGSNITDTRLYAKDGRSLFTVRGDNWNERLGKVTADQIAFVGQSSSSNGNGSTPPPLQPLTLRTLLRNPSQFGKYAGLTDDGLGLSNDVLDQQVSVRFQTTFLPVDEDNLASLEFAPEAYNYNTISDADPRNLILLCTTQGLAIQQDGAGAKKLYHHDVDSVSGEVSRHWLEAERSRHKIGGSQTETKEEREDAVARGKATASVIGVAGMGTRFNVLMTIQVPLEQKPIERNLGRSCEEEYDSEEEWYEEECLQCYEDEEDAVMVAEVYVNRGGHHSRREKQSAKKGISNAARVSKGSFVDHWNGLTVQSPKRHPSEHVTVTIVMYYTCSGGVPTEEDVRAAVDDLEDMYSSIESGHLADSMFDFMKSPLTNKDMADITTKLVTQPPPPPSKLEAPTNYNIFPSS